MTELQWKPVVFLPVNLTVRFDAPVLTGDDPAGWCRSKASDLLGAGADRKQVGKLTQCLEDYATYLRNKDLPTTAALFFYPDFTRIPPRAYAEIFVVGPDPEIGPMTLARARELCGPDERSFGEIEMTEVEAPPARPCAFTATVRPTRTSAGPRSSKSWTGSSVRLIPRRPS